MCANVCLAADDSVRERLYRIAQYPMWYRVGCKGGLSNPINVATMTGYGLPLMSPIMTAENIKEFGNLLYTINDTLLIDIPYLATGIPACDRVNNAHNNYQHNIRICPHFERTCVPCITEGYMSMLTDMHHVRLESIANALEYYRSCNSVETRLLIDTLARLSIHPNNPLYKRNAYLTRKDMSAIVYRLSSIKDREKALVLIALTTKSIKKISVEPAAYFINMFRFTHVEAVRVQEKLLRDGLLKYLLSPQCPQWELDISKLLAMVNASMEQEQSPSSDIPSHGYQTLN